MKKILLLSALMSASVGLTSCGFNVSSSFEFTADDYEAAVGLAEYAFSSTINDKNHVVTVNVDGKQTLVEHIDGTSSMAQYYRDTTLVATAYSFIKDDVYYYAYESDGTKNYMIGKASYVEGYNKFVTYMAFLNLEDELYYDWLYEVTFEGDGDFEENKTLKSSGTFKFEAVNEDLEIKANGIEKDGLFTDLTIKMTTDLGSTVEYALNFEYGKAKVNLPDLSTWQDVTEAA